MWIAGITRGHNGGICLLKDGKIVFALEEERLSRKKYDGGPFAGIVKILDYTDRIDYLVVAHTQPLAEGPSIEFTGDNSYTALARKLGLIDPYEDDVRNHPQVIDLSHIHHKLHAACAFYRSGFETATSVIVDGAGSFIPMIINDEPEITWELETIFDCKYPAEFKTLYKHQGARGPFAGAKFMIDSEREGEKGEHELVIDDTAGIVKAYEAVTKYCGFEFIEAGKTMGLSPYGKENTNIPRFFDENNENWSTSNRNLVIPTYPNGAIINENRYQELSTPSAFYNEGKDLTLLNNRKDLAYAVQNETQKEVLDLILSAVERTGNRNVVLSGGYGLNCVANYSYLETLNNHRINLYVEPISSDAGTCIGAALMMHHKIVNKDIPESRHRSLYLGPDYNIDRETVENCVEKYGGVIEWTDHSGIVDLVRNKNIVALYQGRSENGPRALGNRSLIFDPTFVDGKEYVNTIKNREYFRPFAGSVLHEHADAWFDLKGMDESPHMMYAVNCREGVHEKIPSIIHEDGTCRIQTVKKEDNSHFYDIINKFYEKTDVPIVFNTSFNLGGEPLVETVDDALRTLHHSDLEYLYFPETGMLVTVKN